jgi:hypothetical protein
MCCVEWFTGTLGLLPAAGLARAQFFIPLMCEKFYLTKKMSGTKEETRDGS